MLASVVIPTWNGLDLLKVCLTSLKKQTLTDFEVIVVDNGSIDGSAEYVKDTFPKYKVIKLKENVGFAKAVNIGIKKALSKYIVLINNDTKVDKNCLKYLVKAADEHPDVGFIAAKMLQFYNPKLIDSAGDYLDVVGHADNIGRGEKNSSKYNKPGYLFLASGGGSLFKREVFKKVGFFDEDYFAYMEDVDLCLRAQIYGFKGWYESKAVIYHIHKATSSKNRNLLEYLQFRNMTQTIIKSFPKSVLLNNFNFVKMILVNLNTVRFLAKEGYFLPALKAEWFILTNFLKLLKKRSKIQSNKNVTDEYLISQFKQKKIKIPLLNIRW